MKHWKKMRDINSKSCRTKRILVCGFYETYKEDEKETDLKCYFCTFCYSKRPDKMK